MRNSLFYTSHRGFRIVQKKEFQQIITHLKIKIYKSLWNFLGINCGKTYLLERVSGVMVWDHGCNFFVFVDIQLCLNQSDSSSVGLTWVVISVLGRWEISHLTITFCILAFIVVVQSLFCVLRCGCGVDSRRRSRAIIIPYHLLGRFLPAHRISPLLGNWRERRIFMAFGPRFVIRRRRRLLLPIEGV